MGLVPGRNDLLGTRLVKRMQGQWAAAEFADLPRHPQMVGQFRVHMLTPLLNGHKVGSIQGGTSCIQDLLRVMSCPALLEFIKVSVMAPVASSAVKHSQQHHVQEVFADICCILKTLCS